MFKNKGLTYMNSHIPCQICGNNSLKPQEQEIDILETLSEWEKVVSREFPKSVWNHYKHIESKQKLYMCSTCGFEIFLPPTSGTVDFYNTVTAEDYYVKEKWEHIQGIKDIIKIKPRKLLDFGCGSGDFLEYLREKTPEISAKGFDYSSDAAKIARSRGFHVLSGNFPESLNLPANSNFDVITMFQVLEHVSEPDNIILKAKNLLKDNGFLIIGVPDNEGCVRHVPDAISNMPPHHVSRWRESIFRSGFLHLGFRVARVAKEPLPDYLWEMYLPIMWEDGIWPKKIMEPATIFSHSTKEKRISFFIHMMKFFGIKFLNGVPGHTIYALLQKAD
jgi:2-polyprenyl-3-methyl-5-hydroxy-6-metoxy-1,4-benzoquinol methylase